MRAVFLCFFEISSVRAYTLLCAILLCRWCIDITLCGCFARSMGVVEFVLIF